MTLDRRRILASLMAAPSAVSGLGKEMVAKDAASAAKADAADIGDTIADIAQNVALPQAAELGGPSRTAIAAAQRLLQSGRVPDRHLVRIMGDVVHARANRGELHPTVAHYRSFAPWLVHRLSLQAHVADAIAAQRLKVETYTRLDLARLEDLFGVGDDDGDQYWVRY